VLDIPFFSSIIYIWYEGGRLRPRIVTQEVLSTSEVATLARARPPSGGTMAKKAKKAAKKAKKAKKK
jgi:hypothetical protein